MIDGQAPQGPALRRAQVGRQALGDEAPSADQGRGELVARRRPGELGFFQVEPSALDLAPGSRVLLYTDGLAEARDPRGDLFGVDPIRAELTARRAPATTLDAIIDAVQKHQGGRPREDDLTAVMLSLGEGE